MTHDLVARARAIIDANLYLILGTADPDGRPWTSPVYFAPSGDREFYWLSAADAPALPPPRRTPPGEHRHLRLHRRAVPRPRGVRDRRGAGAVGQRPRPRAAAIRITGVSHDRTPGDSIEEPRDPGSVLILVVPHEAPSADWCPRGDRPPDCRDGIRVAGGSSR